jgi:N utilization substance protein A
MVVNELNGEKVDIIPFSEDPYEFVAKALSPAKVKEVRIDFDTGTAEVIVPDFQLSLAIGKEGQNARLAHRLTGWRIDIKSESQLEEEARRAAEYAEEYAAEEWAEGEWVVDPVTGEQMWQPADGSPAISASEWNQGESEEATEEAAPDDTPAEAEVTGEADVVDDGVVPETEPPTTDDDAADTAGDDVDSGSITASGDPADDHETAATDDEAAVTDDEVATDDEAVAADDEAAGDDEAVAADDEAAGAEDEPVGDAAEEPSDEPVRK